MESGHETFPPETVTRRFRVASSRWRVSSPERVRTGFFLIWIAVVTIAFVQPLVKLFVHAAQSDLLSYIPLVPLVTAYLLYMRRSNLRVAKASIGAAVALGFLTGAILLTAFSAETRLTDNDFLSVV